MSCKKGGLVSIHHNDIRDLTGNILKEVCNDIEVEYTKFYLKLAELFTW